MRSHLVLEVASELVDRDDWPYRQVQIKLKEQGARAWPVTLFGSDTAGVIEQVARGEVQVAIINPAGPLALALRGRGPFTKPIAVRAITVIPSFDQLAFAVTEASGLRRALLELPLLNDFAVGLVDHAITVHESHLGNPVAIFGLHVALP